MIGLGRPTAVKTFCLRAPLVLLCALFVLALSASSAFASAGWWHVSAGARPTVLPVGREAEVVVMAENVGYGVIEGGEVPVRVGDVLPAGVRVLGVSAGVPFANTDPQVLSSACDVKVVGSGSEASCAFEGALEPFDVIELRVEVEAEEALAAGVMQEGVVSGGEVPPLSARRALRAGAGSPGGFGLEEFGMNIEQAGGGSVSQAGSHPYQMTVSVGINQGPDTNPLAKKAEVQPQGLAKDVVTHLPTGLFGDPVLLPTCSLAQFLTNGGGENQCQANAAVGIASVIVNVPGPVGQNTFVVPVFNLEPYHGEPARFGFYIPEGAVPVVLDAALRDGPGEDYGIDVHASDISQTAGLISAQVTVWGVPGDPRHNQERGWNCITELNHLVPDGPCVLPEEQHPHAFLTAPTSCATPLQASVEADSWSQRGMFDKAQPVEPLPTLGGCNGLLFAPVMSAAPTSNSASSPSGLDFNLNFHDEGLTNGEGVVQSQLKTTTVVLPEGFTIDPSAGVGLAGCTPEDYEKEAVESAPGAGCPNESKLGTVEIETPLLTQKIDGNIFIAKPYDNPFPEPNAGHPNGTLVALYVVAKNPETGVLIKLAGKVIPNPVTGQLTTVFENNPQLPFDHFNFHFREGAQAPLITPATCNAYTTQALLAPWSEPLQPLTDDSSFTITTGSGGGACPAGNVPPFTPQIAAGTVNNDAGSFSPLYVRLTRTDAEQEISGFSTNLPEGLTGNLTGVPFCPEADIELARQKTGAQEEAEPSCPASTQIGHTLVGTGVGQVLAYVPGKIYFAGPFKGAPFSIVSVTSAVVGPFDLGTVVLRFGLNIDPYTAKVSVSPTSSEPIPTIIDGIVTHVRDIRVYIDRADFTLNPTSCEAKQISSTLSSSLGASASTASSFQTVNCGNLKFAPKFTVSTQGKTSKAEGASLHVNLTYPTAPQGTYADIAKVKVELPKQLPSRLTTLQKACTAAQFEANFANCPAPSAIGTAKAVVPNIPEPLTGPVYFVSHGNEAFPSLEIVLQGYGVKIILVGATFISKTGITSTTFKAIPDNPVTSFELTLPEGKYSALAANGNLCALTKTVTVKKKITIKTHGKKKTVTRKVKQVKPETLKMPTEFTAQNGATTHQTTQVTVTGCAKVKPAKSKKKAKGKSKGPKKQG